MSMACSRRQGGLTLVETLISIALGLLVLGAVMYAYFGSKGTYRLNKSTARIQEAGHFGLEAMLRDVRSAGFIGCGSRLAVSPTGTGTATAQKIYQIANPPMSVQTTGDALQGYEPTSYASAASGATTSWPQGQATASPPLSVPWYAGDVLTLRIVTGAPVMMVQDPDTSTPSIYLANNCGRLAQGNYLLVANCSSATILRISAPTDVSSASCPTSPPVVAAGVQIQHSGASSDPVTGAPYNVNPTSWNGVAIASPTTELTAPTAPKMTMQSLATAQQFDEVTYYVGQFPPVAGVAVRPPALYRLSQGTFVDAPTQASEEIIDHIENMAIMYGVNLGGTVVCQDAAAVAAAGNWANVVSVQVTLVAVGDELGAVDNAQSFTLGSCGGSALTIPPAIADTRLRQVFTATAALGDRLQ